MKMITNMRCSMKVASLLCAATIIKLATGTEHEKNCLKFLEETKDGVCQVRYYADEVEWRPHMPQQLIKDSAGLRTTIRNVKLFVNGKSDGKKSQNRWFIKRNNGVGAVFSMGDTKIPYFPYYGCSGKYKHKQSVINPTSNKVTILSKKLGHENTEGRIRMVRHNFEFIPRSNKKCREFAKKILYLLETGI